MDSALLKYPNKSHRKKITLPEESSELAEFIGIVFGDGGINNHWQVNISLNSEADLDYADYVYNLVFRLFGICPAVRVRPSMKCRVISAASISLVDFLVGKGAVRGDKVKQEFDIPWWIYNQPDYEMAFVRGLFDTDGGFYTHKHTVLGKPYVNLGFCFVSKSRPLLNSVGKILVRYGINPHIRKDGTSIYLYSAQALDAYMTIFGSSNHRLIDKYMNWRGVRVD